MSSAISQTRSPKYPRIPLTEAISHARRLYDGVHRSTISADTAFRVMGYSGKTGASATVLGALRQYDLVNGLRGDISISDLALRILEPSSKRERSDAIMEAAHAPEAFRAIFAHFTGNVPKSDEPIRAFLIRTMGFGRGGAEDCIKSFRETQFQAEIERHEFPSDEEQAAPEDAVVDIKDIDWSTAKVLSPPEAAASVSPTCVPLREFVRMPLSRDCFAELRFEGEITQVAIDRLVAYIELMKPIWVDE
jgi:hypothetical protein